MALDVEAFAPEATTSEAPIPNPRPVANESASDFLSLTAFGRRGFRAVRGVMLTLVIAGSFCASAFSQGQEGRGNRVTSIDVGHEPLIITHDFDRPSVTFRDETLFSSETAFLTLKYLFQVGDKTVVVLATNLGGSGTLDQYTLLAVSGSGASYRTELPHGFASSPRVNVREDSRLRHGLQRREIGHGALQRRSGLNHDRAAKNATSTTGNRMRMAAF